MQGRHATSVQRVGIRARFDERGNCVGLRRRIPVVRAWTPVGGVVKWFSSPAVSSSHRAASTDEQLGGTSSMRGGSDMQRRVTGIDVVTDSTEEVPVGILAARPDTNRSAYEIGRRVQPSCDVAIFTRGDRTEERKQCAVVFVGVGAPIAALGHPTIVPDPATDRWFCLWGFGRGTDALCRFGFADPMTSRRR